MIDLTGYISVKEAAALMGVTHGHITQLVTQGRLDGLRIGHASAVSRASVESFTRLPHGGWPKGKPRKARAINDQTDSQARSA